MSKKRRLLKAMYSIWIWIQATTKPLPYYTLGPHWPVRSKIFPVPSNLWSWTISQPICFLFVFVFTKKKKTDYYQKFVHCVTVCGCWSKMHLNNFRHSILFDSSGPLGGRGGLMKETILLRLGNCRIQCFVSFTVARNQTTGYFGIWSFELDFFFSICLVGS